MVVRLSITFAERQRHLLQTKFMSLSDIKAEDVKSSVLERIRFKCIDFFANRTTRHRTRRTLHIHCFGKYRFYAFGALGDVPMIRAENFGFIGSTTSNSSWHGAACTNLTVKLDDSTGYGRIVAMTMVCERIVEQKDATDDERKIKKLIGNLLFWYAKIVWISFQS